MRPIVPVLPVLRPPRHAGVEVSATGNDPSQRVKMVRGSDLFTVSGTATNNGIVPSQLLVTIDRHRISVALRGGDTPSRTAERLRAALPDGYTPLVLPTAMGSVTVRIVRAGG